MTISKLCIPKQEYKALKACLSKDKTREALGLVNFGAGYVEATDGKILLRIELAHEIELGAYRVMSEGKLGAGLIELVLEKSEAQYPDTNVIMNVTDKPEYGLIGIEADTNLGITSGVIRIFKYTGNAIAYHFVEILGNLCDQYDVHALGDGKMTLFKGCGGKYKALVMPFCISDVAVEKTVIKESIAV